MRSPCFCCASHRSKRNLFFDTHSMVPMALKFTVVLHAHQDAGHVEGLCEELGVRGFMPLKVHDLGEADGDVGFDWASIASARCCVVLWSAASLAIPKLVSRARECQKLGSLVQLHVIGLEPLDIPIEFTGTASLPLTEWEALFAIMTGRWRDEPFRIVEVWQYISAKEDAHAAHSMGLYNSALLDYDSLVEYEPKKARWRIARAQCLAAIGRHDDALIDWNEALRIDINNTVALLGRAKTYEALGRNDFASADIARVKALGR